MLLECAGSWLCIVCISFAILGPMGQSFQNGNNGVHQPIDRCSFDTAIGSHWFFLVCTSFIWYVIRSSQNNILGTLSVTEKCCLFFFCCFSFQEKDVIFKLHPFFNLMDLPEEHDFLELHDANTGFKLFLPMCGTMPVSLLSSSIICLLPPQSITDCQLHKRCH